MNGNLISALRNMADDIGNIGASPFTVDLTLIQLAIAALEPQWQPIESLVSDELVITWHDFGGINQNTASPHYGKKGYSRIQQRFGGRLFPSEACETGFVSHWRPLPAAPEVSA